MLKYPINVVLNCSITPMKRHVSVILSHSVPFQLYATNFVLWNQIRQNSLILFDDALFQMGITRLLSFDWTVTNKFLPSLSKLA